MSSAYINLDTFRLLIPEIILVSMAAWIFVAGAFLPGRKAWRFFALVGMLLVASAMWTQDLSLEVFGSSPAIAFSGPLQVDYLGHLMRWVVWVVGFLLVLLCGRAAEDDLSCEYLGSLLLIIAGMMLCCTANDLVLLFLGLELISIPTYILLFLGRRDAASHEATAKYFFLGILSSALLLYGMSFLYGIAGSTHLSVVHHVLSAATGIDPSAAVLLPLAMLLILAGLGFKIAVVPFHFYAPDVYQGTTSGNAGLLAVAPKVAGLLVLVRLIAATAPGLADYAWQVVLGLAIVTMTLGNVTALWQKNLRRLMAYSSIAQAGYLLIGIAVALAGLGASASSMASSTASSGLAATLFYLVAYAMASIGTFAALAYLSSRDSEVDSIDELAGLGKTHPLVAFCLAVFMFSLAGIPPLVGFFGKLSLFLGALGVDRLSDATGLGNWFIALAIVGAMNAAVSATYYLRIVAVMYFQESINRPRAEGGAGAWLATALSAALVIALGVCPGPLGRSMQKASDSLQVRSNQHAFRQPPAPSQSPALIKKTREMEEDAFRPAITKSQHLDPNRFSQSEMSDWRNGSPPSVGEPQSIPSTGDSSLSPQDLLAENISAARQWSGA